MERKDVCKYSLKRREKVKSVPTEISIKLSSKGEATFVSDLLFQRLLFLTNDCDIRLDDYKGHELWVYPTVLFVSPI